jgi:octaprenyl-diphosphate synthase
MKGSIADLQEIYRSIGPDLDAMSASLQASVADHSPILAELVDHVSRFRGKMVRPAMVFLSGRACGRVTERHPTLGIVLELIHTATLVHDDILDGALVRRRVESLNAAYGSEVSVLTGDYFFARAFVLIAALEDHAASRELAEMCSRICKGEITQVFQRHNLDLTEEAYTDIVAWKTASLFETGCALGGRFGGADAEASRALGRFGRAIGVAFQIVDDCLDVEGDESVVGKTLGTDADSGKVTLPVIHALRTARARERATIVSIFESARAGLAAAPGRTGRGSETSPSRQSILREILLETGSLEYAHETARSLVDEARAGVEALLAPGPDRDALLTLADYVVRRQA